MSNKNQGEKYMSQPQFPVPPDNLTRDNAISQILSSIAMEELGLSHVINAEGEKLQFVLGTLDGSAPAVPPTVDQVIKVNDSVQKMLETAMTSQMFLKSKMSEALSASNMQGPTGPTGPTGAAIASTFDPAAAPGYTAGQMISYNGNMYIVNTNNPTGTPGSSPDYTAAAGAQGPTGPTGPYTYAQLRKSA